MVSHAALLDAVQAASGSVAVTATVPVPLPEAPEVMVSHAALLVALQIPSATVSAPAPVTVLLRPPTFADGGINVNVAAAPACVIVNVCPAMVKVPAIWLAEVFD